MDIQDLKIFRAVAQHGSISKAAISLKYVQSSVTIRIQQLENELQSQLLLRHNRGITLTSAGRNLLSYADQILSLFDEIQRVFNQNSEPSGSLIIGAIESTATVRLPLFFSDYHKRYPDVDISLVTDTSEELIRSLLRGKVDCAFIAGELDHPEITTQTLFNEELVIVTHPQHPPIKELKDLYHTKLFTHRYGCSYRIKLESWLHEEGIVLTKINELENLELILNSVRAGLGVAIMAESYAELYEKNGMIRYDKIPKEDNIIKTSLIYKKGTILEPMLKLLISTVEENQCNKTVYNGVLP
ncbi:LysR family transcriptional regulator [Rummeliibacillus pycnus]|uniref:LysR family transcriptional regulator n=1 Tax=Rummeliibacillus pycnus TaxID=101070 RepID=UPI003D2AAADB